MNELPCQRYVPRVPLAYFSLKPWPSTESCQMAIAFRPLASSASINSRHGSQALADCLSNRNSPFSAKISYEVVYLLSGFRRRIGPSPS